MCGKITFFSPNDSMKQTFFNAPFVGAESWYELIAILLTTLLFCLQILILRIKYFYALSRYEQRML